MSLCRIYFDEDASNSDLVFALRQRGADALTAVEAGMKSASDESQLLWAASAARVLYTFNAGDYYDLHTQFMQAGRKHAGIVIGSQQRYSVGEQLRRLLRLLNKNTAETMFNRIEFLSHW